MSEERFAAIETRLDSLGAGLDDLRQQVQLQGADLRQEMQSQGADLRQLIQRQGDDLRQQIQSQGDDLGRQMRVLHEDLVDRVNALAPDFGPIRREFTAADAKLKDEIDHRPTPIEAALRKRH